MTPPATKHRTTSAGETARREPKSRRSTGAAPAPSAVRSTAPTASATARASPVTAPPRRRWSASAVETAAENPSAAISAPTKGPATGTAKPATTPGKVATPTAWAKKASSRSTIQHPSSPSGTESASPASRAR